MDTVVSNSPEAIERYWSRVRANGTGEGNGKAGIVVTAHDFAGMAHRREMTPDDARETYMTHRNAAEIAANANAKPLKDQTDGSRNTQIAKMRAGAELAASNAPLAWDAIEWTKAACLGSYGGWYAGITAAKKTLAKKPNIDAAALKAVVVAAAAPKAKAAQTLASRLDSLATQMESIANSDDFDMAIEHVANRFGGAPVNTVTLQLRKLADMAQRVEDEAKPDPEL